MIASWIECHNTCRLEKVYISDSTLTPSLTSMIVNHYKLKPDILTYNLSGMGCSSGLISIELARTLLTTHVDMYAVVLSIEPLTINWYLGNDRSMVLGNCIFRMGGAEVMLSNMKRDRARAKYELIHTIPIKEPTIVATIACNRETTTRVSSEFRFPGN
ncbi:hypothetical protein L1987_63022 [Smallanthus sonchifolius]|uniref:Uncharacterized protein n=1 Tax=Smallanthus sonchifolius TaxID=185202 RepID=A0ACB9CCF8_9ASTR|nr:hypothetical protein L1987_63022 [Smallanthus sonchifolius]